MTDTIKVPRSLIQNTVEMLELLAPIVGPVLMIADKERLENITANLFELANPIDEELTPVTGDRLPVTDNQEHIVSSITDSSMNIHRPNGEVHDLTKWTITFGNPLMNNHLKVSERTVKYLLANSR
jgi:hypothetical protein